MSIRDSISPVPSGPAQVNKKGCKKLYLPLVSRLSALLSVLRKHGRRLPKEGMHLAPYLVIGVCVESIKGEEYQAKVGMDTPPQRVHKLGTQGEGDIMYIVSHSTLHFAACRRSNACKLKVGEGIGGDPARLTRRQESSHTNPGTKVEPQQIVAQRLLSCLQYLVPKLSRLQRI